MDGQPIHGFTSEKVRLLLAYLAVGGTRSHPRDHLVETFWPEHPPEAAHASLRSALSNLRSILKSNPSELASLEADRDTVQLSLSTDCWVDVLTFEQEISQAEFLLAHSEDLPSAMLHYQAAVNLYRGGFLEGFSLKDCPQFDDWCYFVHERLLHKATTALSRLVAYHESRCAYDTAIAYARRRIALEPWQEAAHVHLIRLLALSGQSPAALEQFQVCRQRLQEELEVEPSAETIQLYESIRSGRFAQPQPAPAQAARLPAYLTPMIGRMKELEEIAALLHDPACRLLSLVGPGGSGKTRLAVETAIREGGGFQDGACFVPLVATDKVDAILPTILQTLGVTSASVDLKQTLLLYLRQKELLLVLDNFEQLLLEGSEVLPELLAQAPGVRLLVTSRERLHLEAEWIYPVEGLSLPSPAQVVQARDFDAIRLFSTAAQRQRGFPISDEELRDAIHICLLVSGMPLAIKIAASLTHSLSCAEITVEVKRSLGILESDLRELQSRHRSIQAVFESTWQRLSPEEQSVFLRLSVFRGGFTRQAAEALAGASLRTLTSLIDKCLVTCRPSGRYELHELLRQFAEEKLELNPQEKERTCSLHSQFYLNFIPTMDFDGPGGDAEWVKTDADLDNLKAGWFWAVSKGNFATLDKALEPFANFYCVKDRNAEGASLFNHTLELLPGKHPESFVSRLTLWKVIFEYSQNKVQEQKESLKNVLNIFHRLDLQRDEAITLIALGMICVQDDYQMGIHYFTESLPLYHKIDDQRGISLAIWGLGCLYYAKGFLFKSEAQLRKSLEKSREIEDYFRYFFVLEKMGLVNVARGDVEAANAIYREMQELVQIYGIRPESSGFIHCGLGLVAWRRNQFAESRRLFEEGILSFQEEAQRGAELDQMFEAHFRLLYCQVLSSLGDYASARQQASIASQLFQRAGPSKYLGDPFGAPEAWLARAEIHLDDFTSARRHLQEAFHIWLTEHYTDWILFGLYFWAQLLITEKDTFESKIFALELLAFVEHHPRMIEIDYHPAILGKPALPTIQQAAEDLAVSLTDDEAAVARERGRHLLLQEVAQDLIAGQGRYWGN